MSKNQITLSEKGALADSQSLTLNEQCRSQKRLLEIIDKELPPFPQTVVELTAIPASCDRSLVVAQFMFAAALLLKEVGHECSSTL
ncbi:MAG: hypothetical protein ABSA57_21980 [Candidatus Acidiferrales bacterium]|jgi:hypothetical protein